MNYKIHQIPFSEPKKAINNFIKRRREAKRDKREARELYAVLKETIVSMETDQVMAYGAEKTRIKVQRGTVVANATKALALIERLDWKLRQIEAHIVKLRASQQATKK